MLAEALRVPFGKDRSILRAAGVQNLRTALVWAHGSSPLCADPPSKPCLTRFLRTDRQLALGLRYGSSIGMASNGGRRDAQVCNTKLSVRCRRIILCLRRQNGQRQEPRAKPAA